LSFIRRLLVVFVIRRLSLDFPVELGRLGSLVEHLIADFLDIRKLGQAIIILL
jgi:hypothetical protein